MQGNSPEVQMMHYDIPRPSLPTEILIGKNILGSIPNLLRDSIDFSRYTKFTIISEAPFQDTYCAELRKGLGSLGKPINMPTPLPFEQNKTAEEAIRLLGEQLDMKPSIDSKTLMFAVGGGITCDLAGLISGMYFRGMIDYIQIPTSSLAMVDSSLGGKAAVDFQGRTNVIGLFHLPIATVMDVSVLHTLPPRHFVSGLAELVKHSFLDPSLYRFLSGKGLQDLLDNDVLIEALTISTRYKMSIVTRDYEERTGIRTEVHLGHTVGRALETAAGLGVFTHGEAVAIGTHAAVRISNRVGLLSEPDTNNMIDTMKRFGLTIETSNIDRKRLWEAMRLDKKSIDGSPRFVLLEGIGKPKIGCPVDEKIVNEVLDQIIC